MDLGTKEDVYVESLFLLYYVRGRILACYFAGTRMHCGKYTNHWTQCDALCCWEPLIQAHMWISI